MVKYVSVRNLKEGITPEQYEKYYREEHLPKAGTIPGVKKITIARVLPWGDKPAPYYRMTEIYFDNMEALQKGMASPEAQALATDKTAGWAAEGTIKFLAEEEQVLP